MSRLRDGRDVDVREASNVCGRENSPEDAGLSIRALGGGAGGSVGRRGGEERRPAGWKVGRTGGWMAVGVVGGVGWLEAMGLCRRRLGRP